MKNKKLLAIILVFALLAIQFSMLTTVFAVSPLSGRSDFVKGVAIHSPVGYQEYVKQYDAVLDAEALGANLVRTGSVNDSFDKAFAAIANDRGMKVMFHKSLDIAFVEGGSVKTPGQIGYDAFQAVYDRFYSQATALKDYDCYIQIDNELDLTFKLDYGLSTSYSGYNSVDSAAIAIYLANKAVQDANTANGSNIKTVVNFSYQHYGFLDALKRVYINPSTYTSQSSSSGAVYADWDIIGLDYYSNMYDNATYQSIISAVKSKFGKNIIICEANLIATGMTGSTVNYEEDTSWLESFVRYCYADSSIIGFCVYELYDEAHFESDNQFHKEAHYGLLDKDGNKKDTYNLFCDLYGGTGTVADRTIPAAPAYPDYADVEISRDGISTAFSSNYISTSDRLCLDFTDSPRDLSSFSQFEFDLYIENYDDFVAINPYNGGRRINFALSNHDSDKTKQRIRFDIANQITQSGWNHIVLPKSSRWQCDSGFDYDAVTYAMIFFQDGGSESNPISGMKVAIANVLGTTATDPIDIVPDWPDYEHIKANAGGTGAGVTYDNGVKNYPGAFNKTKENTRMTSDPVNVNDTTQVEFDFYIDNYDDFIAGTEGHDLRFRFGNDSENYFEMAVKSKITQSGWNHVVLGYSKGHPDRTAYIGNVRTAEITYYAFTWNPDSGDNSGTNFRNKMIRVANVCFTTTEINRLPDWPEYEHVKLSRQSNAVNWGSGTSTFCVVWNGDSNPGVSQIGTADVTGTNHVEFDLYVEDYDSYISRGDGKMLMFGFGSSGGKWRNVYIQNKITHSGWNHITATYEEGSLDYGDNTGNTTPDFTGIMQYRLKFYSSVTAPSGQVRIANVCFTYRDLPDWPEYEHIEILRSNSPNWWGNGMGSSNHLVTGLTDTDMSDTDQVEFDVYIGSYSKFVSLTASGDVRFRFGSAGDNYIDVNIKNKITHDGWNHVVAVWLPSSADSNTDRFSLTGNPDLTAIRWVKLYTTLNISWNSLCRTQIANVCFTKKEINRIPDWPAYEHIELLKSNDANWWGGANSSNHLVSGLPETDIRNTDQVEFDVYIDNYEGFVSETAGGNVLFRFGSAGDNYIDVNVKDKITHNGWNHVAAVWLNSGADPDTDRHSLTGDPVLGAIRWVKLYSTVAIRWDVCGRTRIANVCFTSKPINRAPEYPDSGAIELSETGIKKTWGDKYNYTVDRVYVGTTGGTADLSDAANIEFDIYIDDYAAFTEAISGKALRFTVASGANRQTDRSAYDFASQITGSGWNHITVDKTATTSANSADFTSIKWMTLTYWNGAGVDNPIGGTAVRIANICGSGLTSSNDDVMATKTSVIGAVSETVKFDATGNYNAGITADISGDRMIELDVFVRSYSPVDTLSVTLSDSASGSKSFSFTGLSNGWNHLAKRLSDGEGSINPANVTGYTVSGTAGAVVYVSNLYTASYLNGDADRDNSLTVRDLMRAKNYMIGNTSKGNTFAMSDTSAGNYCQNVRKVLVDGAW